MKAVLCKTLDGPQSLTICELPDPEPGPREVVVRVTAAALNFFDTLITRGKYQNKPELPFSPVGEIAGVVARIGAGVEGLVPGQRVACHLGWGGARELVVVKPEQCVPIPDGVSDAAAAGVAITYGTAIHGLRDRGGLAPSETIAVLGASGGAGLAAVEIARLMGARVIAVASSPEKLAVAKAHGAEILVDYAAGDLKEMLRAATGGKGVDVVYDCVGGPYAEPALRAIAPRGRYLVVGFAAGEIPKLPLNLVMLKDCDVRGVLWGRFVKTEPKAHRANMEQVLAWIADGVLKPRIHGSYPMADIIEALGILDRREAVGKVVLVP
ncbi:MAG: NADPH:quinone oxidoreductase family protein [Hyphomicrobiaceae bacterium]|nr:NADPH:quinone oxidoreductase family protein [Hyphomicrobiaceae bacterium]